MANTFIGHDYRERALHKLWADYPDVFSPLQAIYTAAGYGEEPIPLERDTLMLAEGVRRAWDAPDARHREWHIFRLRQKYHELTIRTTSEEQVEGAEAMFIRTVAAVQATKDAGKQVPDDLKLEGDDLLQRLGDLQQRLKEEQRRISEPPPDPTPLEAALYHLQRTGDRARHCLNSDCPAPYFIATKRWQRYCSPECALPAQREAKRRWWNDNRAKTPKSK